MVIQGTIKFVNPSKENPNTGKMGQSIKVAIPGEDIYVNGKANSFDHLQKDQQVMVEKDGQWWRLAKDQSGVQVTSPGAPMSATPATVTNGQGYAPPATASKEAMIAWGEQCTDLYLHIFNKITLSPEFAAQDVPIQKEAAATVFIAAVKRFERP